MPLEIVHVDAFTSRPFTGNPAAVCILQEPPPDWMLQDIASELNLSNTAFLLPHEEGYDLRWFTPRNEVDLCGHATLASAHVLWEDGHLSLDESPRFHTRSGILTASIDAGWIQLDFPMQPARESAPPPDLIRAVGVEPVWAGRSRLDWLLELPNEKIVRTLQPDMALLSTIETRGVIVTSVPITANVDFVSRFFAPREGLPEDPVTGSAHCTLGPYWAEKLGKESMVGYQVSSRGGTVRVSQRGDRTELGGQAVTMGRMALNV